jgi:KipI family sensor histidine kinase inhibitor
MTDVRMLMAGDSAMVLRLGDRIDPLVNARALAVARHLGADEDQAIRDVVVGYASVTVYFDPLALPPAAVAERLRRAAEARTRESAQSGKQVVIPVRYGGTAGPDLSEVASFAGCTEDEVVSRHVAREYRVFMIGFLPGFPYMGVVDESIAMPRRETPRLAVPAGSVGIAGPQTGIYPVQSPGGWRLIGRTEAPLFDAGKTPPTLVQPGDAVRFRREA